MSISAISFRILEHVRKIITKIKFNQKRKYVEMYVEPPINVSLKKEYLISQEAHGLRNNIQNLIIVSKLKYNITHLCTFKKLI